MADQKLTQLGLITAANIKNTDLIYVVSDYVSTGNFVSYAARISTMATKLINLTGEVTSVGNAALLNKTAISNRTTVTPAVDDYLLLGDTDDTGNLKKVTVQSIIDLAGGGGGGGGITYGAAVTTGHNSEILYIDGTGALASDDNFTRADAADDQDMVLRSANFLDVSAFVELTTTGGTRGEFRAENSVNNSKFFVEADTMGMTSTNQVGLTGGTVISQTTSGGASINMSSGNQLALTVTGASGLIDLSGQGAAAFPRLQINYDGTVVLSNTDNADYSSNITLAADAMGATTINSTDSATGAVSEARFAAGSSARISDTNTGKVNSLDLGSATHAELKSTDTIDNTDRITLTGDGATGLTIASQNAASATSLEVKPTESVLYGPKHTVTATDGTNIDSIVSYGDGSNGVNISSFNGTDTGYLGITPLIIQANVDNVVLNTPENTFIGDYAANFNQNLFTFSDTNNSALFSMPSGSFMVSGGPSSFEVSTSGDYVRATANEVSWHTYEFGGGDLNGNVNSTYIQALDVSKQISLNTTGTAQMGDLLGAGNSTLIATADATSQIDINSRDIVQIGDLAPFANNTTVIVNDPAKTIDLNSSGVITIGDVTSAGNDTKTVIDDDSQQITLAGGLVFNQKTVSADYDVLPSDYYVDVDPAGGPIDITLPPVSDFPTGKTLVITDKTGNAATNNITIIADSTAPDAINGSGTYTINLNRQSITMHTDGVSNWTIN